MEVSYPSAPSPVPMKLIHDNCRCDTGLWQGCSRLDQDALDAARTSGRAIGIETMGTMAAQ